MKKARCLGHTDDYPRSMRCDEVRKRRDAMLRLPHVRSLTRFARKLEKENRGDVPDFDPLDGGINARVLFLFEKPGPKTARGAGSGFISRTNNDQTAARTFACMKEAGFSPKEIVIWNVIPWWNGKIKVTKEELALGLERLKPLLKLLKRVHTVVLVGNKAKRAAPFLAELPHIRVFCSCHPSPRARGCSRYVAIAKDWKRARKFSA